MTTPPSMTPHDSVLKKIETGALRMRPRILFTARFFVVVLIALVVLVLSAYVMSLILFSLEEGGEEFLLGFGGKGLLTFITLFPWRLFLLDVILIVGLRLLIHGLKPVYRFSFSTVLAGLVVASGVVALVIHSTPFHRFLLERALEDDLPFLSGLYQDLGEPDEEQGEFRGVITHIEGRTLTIVHDDGDGDADDGVRSIIIPEPLDISVFTVGEEVYVAGEEYGLGEHIRAYGIQKIPRSKHEMREGAQVK